MPVILTTGVLLAALSCGVTWLQGRGSLASLQPARLWNWYAISLSTLVGVFVLFLAA